MTNNAISLQGILSGQSGQFYHSLTKYNLKEFHFSNTYKNVPKSWYENMVMTLL
jgi:hypothetical protein